MSQHTEHSRRLFLKQSAALASLGAGAPLAINLAAVGEAAAQSSTASGYKALVCIFLQGGNDSFNTVLATDDSSWSIYSALRNQAPTPIALAASGVERDTTKEIGSPAWLGGVLPLTPATAISGRSLALHPRLTNLQGLFNTHRRLAVVANVGPLKEPTTKAQITAGTARLPTKLYSHNDQQNTWQSFSPEGATKGWGGRMSDYFFAGQGQSIFTAVSASGNSVWLSGNSVSQYQLATSGAVRLGVLVNSLGTEHIFGSPEVAKAALKITGAPSASSGVHPFAKDIAAAAARSVQAETLLRTTMPSATTAPFGPDSSKIVYTTLAGASAANPLAKQLQVVARMMSIQASLGVKRQVFFVSIGGFDNHDNQNRNHAELMAKLDHAMGYFDGVLTQLGMQDKVTTFTASDFGRTFTSNGDGTDHGWGGHHFVMGGAVRGGQVYGTLPTYGTKRTDSNLFNSTDQLQNGVLLPSMSVDQYGAALGRWFGLSDTQLKEVLPNLASFGTSTIPGFLA